MNLKNIAQKSKEISVKNFNRRQKYHCDNYTLAWGGIPGQWRLYLNGEFVMNESHPRFFEIVDTFQWYRQLTPELYQLIGEETSDELERAEEKFFEKDLEEVINEYHAPSTRV